MYNLIPEILHQQARRTPQRRAIIDSKGEVTYGALSDAVADLAHGLRAKGLTKGGRCVCVFPNSIDFFLAHFAAITAGGVSVPCEYNITASNFSTILKDCEAEFVLIAADVFTRLTDAISRLDLHAVIIFGPAKLDIQVNGPVYLLSEIIAAGKQLPSRLHQLSENDLAAIMYTTGSTGAPKGVLLKQSNVMAALRNITRFVGYTEDDSELIILPVSHNFGLGHAYCNLMNGGFIYLANGMSRIGRIFGALEKYKITGFPGTPLGYGLLLDRFAEVFAAKASSLRFIVIDSAPMPPERTKSLQALLPHVNIMVYYGPTEASRSTYISLTAAGPNYYQSVGRPMENIVIDIQNEFGENLAPGKIGEVVISGPTVTEGYWKKPDQTAAVLRNGKMHSGDIGYLDNDGYLFITGRIKDVINVGGLKLNPSETEETLQKFPGVCDVGVVGLDGIPGITGEAVVAGLALDKADARDFDREACMRFCLGRLEKFKVPIRLFILDHIPRTDSGKIKRHELVETIKSKMSENN